MMVVMKIMIFFLQWNSHTKWLPASCGDHGDHDDHDDHDYDHSDDHDDEYDQPPVMMLCYDGDGNEDNDDQLL